MASKIRFALAGQSMQAWAVRFRLLSLSFLLACLGAGTAWLSFLPAAAKLVSVARAHASEPIARNAILSTQALLPLALGLTVLILTGLIFFALSLLVGRPLARMEEVVEQIGQGDFSASRRGSGPLLSRLEGTLRRTAEALKNEQVLTRAQLEQIQKGQADLLAAERLATVGKLAAGVAHEVGNPLSGILGYVSLAKDRVERPAEVSDFLERIEKEVGRIDGIVRGLLDLGRPARVEVLPIDLGPLLQNCVKLFSASRDQDKVQVELICPSDALALGSTSAVTQVMVNLLINASAAMKGHGRVILQVEDSEDTWSVHVLDDGPGFSPLALSHLFEPFFTTKEVGRGTGLGLAVSRSLADGMGAQLQAGNREEGGARLTLVLKK